MPLTPDERALVEKLQTLGEVDGAFGELVHAILASMTETVIPMAGTVAVRLLDAASAARKQRVTHAFCEGMLRALLRLERGKIDRDWIATEDFMQRVASCAQAAYAALGDEKIRVYQQLVLADATRDVDHSWFPTARQLVDRVEPIHIQELKLLGMRRGSPKSVLDLVQGLWSNEYAARGLVGWPPLGFTTAPWEKVKAGPGLQEEPRTWLQERGDAVLADLWYLGGIGLIHQIHPDHSDANALSERLLAFLAAGIAVPEQ
jgi:hypothetical protein